MKALIVELVENLLVLANSAALVAEAVADYAAPGFEGDRANTVNGLMAFGGIMHSYAESLGGALARDFAIPVASLDGMAISERAESTARAHVAIALATARTVAQYGDEDGEADVPAFDVNELLTELGLAVADEEDVPPEER